MIQNFASVYAVGNQAVRGRAISNSKATVFKNHKLIVSVLTGAVLLGMAASLSFFLLIRSGLNELAVQSTAKAEIVKTQNGLLAKREALLDQRTFARSAEKLGLYAAESRQIRRL